MKVNYGDAVVYLERDEVVEIVLPDGNSVWVRGDGTVSKQGKERA